MFSLLFFTYAQETFTIQNTGDMTIFDIEKVIDNSVKGNRTQRVLVNNISYDRGYVEVYKEKVCYIETVRIWYDTVHYYSCNNQEPVECPGGLSKINSDGKSTRCYKFVARTGGWFNCRSTGWQEV